MDAELKQLLKQIIANQAVIYKKVDTLERKLKGSSMSASLKSYLDEMTREAAKVINEIPL